MFVWLHLYNYSQKLVVDRLNTSINNPSDTISPTGQISIIVDDRDHPSTIGSNFTDILQEFDMHGTTFTNVYYKEPTVNEKFTLYYNTEIGIVGFKSITNEISLKFDRIE